MQYRRNPSAWWHFSGVTEEEARTIDCPKCGAKAGEPCTYTWARSRTIPHEWSCRATKERYARVGTPTKRAHNERGNAKSQQEWDMWRLQEYWRLCRWLEDNADIFKEENDAG